MILLEDFVFDRDFVARRSDPVIADLGYLGSMVFIQYSKGNSVAHRIWPSNNLLSNFYFSISVLPSWAAKDKSGSGEMHRPGQVAKLSYQVQWLSSQCRDLVSNKRYLPDWTSSSWYENIVVYWEEIRRSWLQHNCVTCWSCANFIAKNGTRNMKTKDISFHKLKGC